MSAEPFIAPPLAGLKGALDTASPLYVLPRDPVTAEVLLPALRTTRSLDMMMGYFASSSFAEIAPGLAVFLRNETAPLRLIISPFLTAGDFDTLGQSEDALSAIAQRIMIDDVPDEDLLVRHTLECLAWLITQRRLVLKVAVMRDALFHIKTWLFADGQNRAALHGSMNFTGKGLTRNREQLSLSRDWRGEDAVTQIDRLDAEFQEMWGGGDKDCLVITLPEAVAKKVVQRFGTGTAPREVDFDFDELWTNAQSVREDRATYEAGAPIALKIPAHLNYESGDFAHQGEAVGAWEGAGRRGILEMATGAGKTITSMICAAKLQDELGKVLVVVSAPYRPLIEQWCGEIREFGVNPINLTAVGGPSARDREIKQAGRRLRRSGSRAEILVVSNDTLCTDEFVAALSQIQVPKLFIADECHNLGAASFTENPPSCFDYRLGLSATPVRQYDDDGTAALVEYFGDICYSFTLEQAIGKCLTEYDYHVHFVELTDAEMQEWYDLTAKISGQAWKIKKGASDPYLDNLLRMRRLVLETAEGKIGRLASLIDEDGPRALQYTLVYATDKQPAQLDSVNALLEQRGVLFHQLTQEETGSRDRTARILADFQEGTTQVLTAKRVLDEGVNIPQIKLAYILASTTVKRQWVQRRGRLLRTCKAIGKTHAIIHDFVVLPPGMSSSADGEPLDQDARKLVRSELERVWEFARLSRNGPADGGPYEAVRHLQTLANAWGVD